MESTDAAMTIPFKSKKSLHNTPKKPTLPPLVETPKKPQPAVGNLPVSKTPEISNQKRRNRNLNAVFSIGAVRKAAQMLQKSNPDRSNLTDKSDLQTGDSDQFQTTVGVNPKKSLRKSIELPEKYDMLCEFFNAMVSSIHLIRLKRSSPTFTNICPKVESLTDRRFTINHLAQLKHVLPEAIVIKRIRVRDEETNCMKEELHVSLDAEALKHNDNTKDIIGGSQLKKVFRARITKYHETHPEGDDIPEGTLPELFHQPTQAQLLGLDETSRVSAASQIPLSFRRSFSNKVPIPEMENAFCIQQNPANWPNKSKAFESSPAPPPPPRVAATPSKEVDFLETKGSSSTETISADRTPARLVSTPARLMAATPLNQEKRCCYMSPDDGMIALPNKLLRRSDTVKSLKFDPPEDDTGFQDQANQAKGSFDDSEIDFLPEDLLRSIREKEQRIMEEQDPAISQAKRRKELISRLPKLFDMIHLLFQSINRTVITKEELIYKIIGGGGHLDIVDRGEVEEQLKLLQNLAPDYLSEQLCLSGDTLLRLNRSSSAASIRAKLLDAK
ncbi:hypothetical protein Nepgr_027615 [Nepenthes gracilis]|uniref:CDT1 Geminin-binding domain-containing protein n=1 Tax=Nepenthes gracilis TaxID=150966 RepID=A0AAD3TC18_NEPGR|nr:hypothetical protein Nepgr_027615 [Nepenthes gracilis]